jgi:Domain of unknown function (DUF4893)
LVPPRPFLPLTLAAAAALAGCQTLSSPPPAETGATVTLEEPEAWRSVATPSDAASIDALADDWAAARDAVRAARLARRAEAQGPLLDPAASLPRAAPAPGPYACRLIRLGGASPQARPWRESGGFFCYVGVEGDRLSLTVEGGPERLGGYLWEEKSTARLVFLGAAAPPRHTLPAYGDDPGGNAVGVLERVGEFRYRLVLPGRGGSRLGVYELEAAPR